MCDARFVVRMQQVPPVGCMTVAGELRVARAAQIVESMRHSSCSRSAASSTCASVLPAPHNRICAAAPAAVRRPARTMPLNASRAAVADSGFASGTDRRGSRGNRIPAGRRHRACAARGAGLRSPHGPTPDRTACTRGSRPASAGHRASRLSVGRRDRFGIVDEDPAIDGFDRRQPQPVGRARMQQVQQRLLEPLARIEKP